MKMAHKEDIKSEYRLIRQIRTHGKDYDRLLKPENQTHHRNEKKLSLLYGPRRPSICRNDLGRRVILSLAKSSGYSRIATKDGRKSNPNINMRGDQLCREKRRGSAQLKKGERTDHQQRY